MGLLHRRNRRANGFPADHPAGRGNAAVFGPIYPPRGDHPMHRRSRSRSEGTPWQRPSYRRQVAAPCARRAGLVLLALRRRLVALGRFGSRERFGTPGPVPPGGVAAVKLISRPSTGRAHSRTQCGTSRRNWRDKRPTKVHQRTLSVIAIRYRTLLCKYSISLTLLRPTRIV